MTDYSDGLPLGNLKGLAEVALELRKMLGKPPKNLSAFSGMIHQSGMLGDAPTALLKEESRQIHSVMSWVDAGLPTFDLTHGLMAALLLTDPSNIDAAEVKLPFSTFVVRLPDGFWELHGMNDPSKATTASLVIVHTYEAITTKGGDELQDLLSFQILGRIGSTTTWEARKQFPESGPIGDWIADDVETVVDPTGWVGPPDDLDHRHAIAFRRLLVNLCLYIGAHGRGERLGRQKPAGGRKPARSGQGRTGLQGVAAPDVWILGREVKLDRELVQSAKAWSEARDGQEKTRSAWALRARFTVRGHWRNQAHGPGRVDRRLQWIAPYWKGEGPSFAHVYKVEE